MKRIIKIVFLVCVIGFMPNLKADNLIKNGSLEDKAGWGLPAEGSWQKEKDNQFFRLEQQKSGKMLMIYKEFSIPKGTKALRFSVDARTTDVVKGDKPWFGARVLGKLVDKDNKIIFGWSAKCGCSHAKHIYWFLKTGNLTNKIHSEKSSNPLPNDIQNYTTLLFTRNPYERLVSGFLDKYARPKGKYRNR